MTIIAGVPNVVHREITMAEVDAIAASGINVITSAYGNSNEVTGVVGRLKRILQNAIELKNKVVKAKADIVYLNTAFDQRTLVRDCITVFIIRLFNKQVKFALKLHGSMENIVASNTGSVAKLKNYLLKNIDLLFVLSSEERNNFLKIGVAPEKVKITANALDTTLYKQDEFFHHLLNHDDDFVVLLFVGRLMQEKGILDLIEACKILKAKGLKYHLFCLGDGPAKDEIIDSIESADLVKDIRLVGYIPESETRSYYANCDMLILPSYNEGFPMAVFQAVAAGKPVITTKIRASADYLKENENCLWVSKGHPAELAEKIMQLSSDKNLQSIMKANNLELARRFTKENLAKQTIDSFKGILRDKVIRTTTSSNDKVQVKHEALDTAV